MSSRQFKSDKAVSTKQEGAANPLNSVQGQNRRDNLWRNNRLLFMHLRGISSIASQHNKPHLDTSDTKGKLSRTIRPSETWTQV